MTATTATRETFHFLAYGWDVTEAERITAGRPTIDISVEQAAMWFHLIRIDKAHAATVDLTKPTLIVPVKDAGHIPIDGWHRFWKAHEKGLATLPARLLTSEEEH
ncbi:hypothetical protein, partial [Planotetraspora phitsanulokensis]